MKERISMIEIKIENYQCEDYCGYFGNAVIVTDNNTYYEDELYRCVNCDGFVNSESYIAEMNKGEQE